MKSAVIQQHPMEFFQKLFNSLLKLIGYAIKQRTINLEI